jgi:hypothetical protein
MEIAKTIIEQIKYADKWALMAWFKFIALPESEYQGGLQFQCSSFTKRNR